MARKPYMTKTRSAILDYLKTNWAKTISVSDIMDHMKEIGASVNQTTVYRYLDRLCEDHVIVRYADSSGEKSVYQYLDECSNCENHLHLKCTQCGKMIHMDCGFVDEFREHLLKDHNFEIQFKGNMLYGVCKECSMKKNQNKSR